MSEVLQYPGQTIVVSCSVLKIDGLVLWTHTKSLAGHVPVTVASVPACWGSPVRIPGFMPRSCVLHAYVPVFACHVQPLWGGSHKTPFYESA